MPQRNIHDVLAAGRAHLSAARDRVATGLAGRSRQVIAVAALASVTTVGLAAATIDTPNTAGTTAVAVAERAAAADRPDRSTREADTTTTKTTTGTKDAAKSASPSPKASKKPAPKWVSPLPGAKTTSCYGQRWGVLHAGIDFAAPSGTPIHAVGAGKVVAAGWTYTGYGISVVVKHSNGYLTHYAHMSKKKVKVGDKVKPGTVLGLEGSTGDSTGPHLHFEVHKGSMWNQINPAGWLDKRHVKNGC